MDVEKGSGIKQGTDPQDRFEPGCLHGSVSVPDSVITDLQVICAIMNVFLHEEGASD